MGQILFQDKIGALTNSGSNILMAASSSAPAYLTIGGQQYAVTSQLSVAKPSLTANARYQVFAVQSAGVVSLVISQNENSTGPAGFSSWKLVGCFRANGLASVAFGSFINIVGIPKSDVIGYLPVFTNLGTVVSIEMFYSTNGKNCEIHGKYTMGTGAAALATISIPFTTESSSYIPSVTQVGPVMFGVATSVFSNLLATAGQTAYNFGFTFSSNLGLTSINGNAFGAASVHAPSSNYVPMVELSDTPIQDR